MSDGAHNSVGKLTLTGEGWTGKWNAQTFAADRELKFKDGPTLAAACGVRCRQCSRFIAWAYRHPDGDVLIRRLPAESDDPGDALTFLASLAKGAAGNIKADTDSLLSRLDGSSGDEEARAWCVECRGWRTVSLVALRTALANHKTTIRANSADIP